jgi:hypothetical protein
MPAFLHNGGFLKNSLIFGEGSFLENSLINKAIFEKLAFSEK